MPVIWRHKGYRFYFYSNEGAIPESPHIHVRDGERVAKFWLDPVRLEDNQGFDRRELSCIRKLVDENADDLLRSWNEFFELQDAGSEGSAGDNN